MKLSIAVPQLVGFKHALLDTGKLSEFLDFNIKFFFRKKEKCCTADFSCQIKYTVMLKYNLQKKFVFGLG